MSRASIICGVITERINWQWLFHILQIFNVILAILIVFLCPETSYIRDSSYNIDSVREENYEQLAALEQSRAQELAEEKGMARSQSRAGPHRIPHKKSYVQSLALYTGSYSDENVLKLIVSPFVTLLNIGADWSTFTSGMLNCWFVGTAITQALVFAGPPWSYNSAQVGYLSTGPFIGGLLGTVFVSLTSDTALKYLSRQNKGVYEPEFRIVHMPVSFVFVGVGFFGYGHMMAIGASAYACATFQGLLTFGVVIGLTSSISYGLDAYREMSNELFIMNMVLMALYDLY